MKKIHLLIIVLCGFGMVQAQTKIEKTIPVQAGQKLVIHFDYPEVKLQTWDKNEVYITGTVSINRGENDNAFELQVASTAQELTVTSVIKDKENLPQRIMIKKGDTEYTFKAKNYNDPEIQKFLEDNKFEYSYMSSGIIREIKLEVFVPKKLVTHVDSKYGLVEVKNFEAPLTIDAKFGGIDATISAKTKGELTARTRFGEILTNLDIKFDENRSMEKRRNGSNSWTEISARPGTGPSARFESKFGTIYLRKPN